MASHYDPYVPPKLLNFYHSLPRYGRSSHFALIASDSYDDRINYVAGIAIFCVSIFAISLAWMLLILTVRWLRIEKSAFLSMMWQNAGLLCLGCRPWFQTPRFQKRAYFLSGLVLILSCIFVFSLDGVATVKTRKEIKGSIQYVTDILASDLNDTQCPIISTNASSLSASKRIVDVLAAFCRNATGIDGMERHTPQPFTDEVENINASFRRTFDVLSTGLWAITVVAFSVSGLMSFLIIYAVFLLWTPYGRSLMTRVSTASLWYIAMVAVFLLWIVIAVIGLGMLVNVDVCSGRQPPYGPDGMILDILDIHEVPTSSKVRRDIEYLLTGCTAPIPVPWVGEVIRLMSKVDSPVGVLADMVSENDSFAKEICPWGCSTYESEDALEYVTDMLDNDYCPSYTYLNITCRYAYPLYTSAVHNVGCVYFPNASMWTFSLFFMMAFCAMIMITVFSSYVKVKQYEDERQNRVERTNKVEVQVRTLGSALHTHGVAAMTGGEMLAEAAALY